MRGGRGCATGTERTFRPVQVTDAANNTDFDGPRVFVAPDGRVIVLTYRCCAIDGPNFHSAALFRYISPDAGRTSMAARSSASPTWPMPRSVPATP